MSALQEMEDQQRRAREARRQAVDLRDLHGTATCGLGMSIQYGNRKVPMHIAMRVADQYPKWADEYDAIAEEIEADINKRLGVSE